MDITSGGERFNTTINMFDGNAARRAAQEARHTLAQVGKGRNRR
jgi:hypothetical protein